MKHPVQNGFVAALIACVAVAAPAAEPPALPAPADTLALLRKAADWQLANPGKHPTTDWTQGALYTGLSALSDLTGEVKYRDALVAIGETNAWKPGRRVYHADDHAVGQMYLELYRDLQDPRMIAPLPEDSFFSSLPSL